MSYIYVTSSPRVHNVATSRSASGSVDSESVNSESVLHATPSVCAGTGGSSHQVPGPRRIFSEPLSETWQPFRQSSKQPLRRSISGEILDFQYHILDDRDMSDDSFASGYVCDMLS